MLDKKYYLNYRENENRKLVISYNEYLKNKELRVIQTVCLGYTEAKLYLN